MAREAASDPDVITLGAGLPAEETLPSAELSQAFARVMSSPKLASEALQYGWPEGAAPLREYIAHRLAARGATVEPDEVIVTSGAQQALALIVSALKPLLPSSKLQINVGERSYAGALELFRAHGFACVVEPAPVVYAMPALANPGGERGLGPSPSPSSQPGTWFIEDDAYADLSFDGRTPRSWLAINRCSVFHVGTLSKTVCPGLRVGWVVPPPALARSMLHLKREADIQTAGLGQSTALAFLQANDFDERLARLRTFYATRADALMSALRTHLPSWRFVEPEGGFSLWAEPDVPLQEAGFVAACLEAGVSLDPGSACRPVSPGQEHTIAPGLRLCFSSQSERRLQAGTRRLARAYARLAASVVKPA